MGFGREVGFVGVKVDGDGLLPREVEDLCAESQLLNLGGICCWPEDRGESTLKDREVSIRSECLFLDKRFGFWIFGAQRRAVMPRLNG